MQSLAGRSIGVEVAVRRKREERRTDDHADIPADEWLSQFRPVRPDAFTSADRDAAARPPSPQQSDAAAPSRAYGPVGLPRRGGPPTAVPAEREDALTDHDGTRSWRGGRQDHEVQHSAADWDLPSDRAADQSASQRPSGYDGREPADHDSAAGAAGPGQDVGSGRAFGLGRDYRVGRDDRLRRRQREAEPWRLGGESREYRVDSSLAGERARDRVQEGDDRSAAGQSGRAGLSETLRAQREPALGEPAMSRPSLDDIETGQLLRHREDSAHGRDYRGADGVRGPDGVRADGGRGPDDYRDRSGRRGRDDVPGADGYRDYRGADGVRGPDGVRADDGRGPDGYRDRSGGRGREAYRDRDGYRGADDYRVRGGRRGQDDLRGPDGYPSVEGYPRPDGYPSVEGYPRPDGYPSDDRHRRPGGYPSDGRYRRPDDYRDQDGRRSPDGRRSTDGYPRDDADRPDDYRRHEGYRGPVGPRDRDGYLDDGYQGSDRFGRDGYRGATDYPLRSGYREADGYHGPDRRRSDNATWAETGDGRDRRYPNAGSRRDGYQPDGRRHDGRQPDDRTWSAGASWRPESYADTAIPASRPHERDVYVVTDLPERRGSSYRHDPETERRDRDGRRTSESMDDGPGREGADGFGSPGMRRPAGPPPSASVRFGASLIDDGDRVRDRGPAVDRADRGGQYSAGAPGTARAEAPRVPGAPLELPAGTRAAGQGANDPLPAVIDRVIKPASVESRRDEDEERTSPLPVILPGATSVPRPEPVAAPRGPFEAARPGRPTSVTGSVEPPPAANAVTRPTAALTPLPPLPQPGLLSAPPARSASRVPEPPLRDLPEPPLRGLPEPPHAVPEPAHAVPEAAAAKLDQLKDLYFAAEAIGEERLDKHFDQVSQRQRELIREFFERSNPAG